MVYSILIFLAQNFHSNLYKVLFAQMCPNCKVMIIRLEGCKFMECAKCKYQFCWWCLSEFYTTYHYYVSLCPLRVVPIYLFMGLMALIIYLKFCYVFPFTVFYQLVILKSICHITYMVLFYTSFSYFFYCLLVICYQKIMIFILKFKSEKNHFGEHANS